MRGCSAFCRGFGAAAAAAAAAALLLCPLTVVNTEEPATAPSISPHESVPHAAPQPHQEDPVEPQEDLSSEQLDAILEGIQTFRPGAKPLSRGKGYDAASPLEATTPQKNLQRLEESLGASWFADSLRERGQEACMRLREQSEDCPSAAAAAGVAALNCNMAEVSVAKEAAVQLEESLVGSSGEDRLRCSRLFTRLLLYIDLMVFYQPFKAFQEGKSAKDALQEAFVHWGFRGDNQDDGTLATPPEVVAETSLLQARSATSNPSAPLPEAPPITIASKDLTEALLSKNPKSQVFLSSAFNPTLKIGLLLLFLAHIRFDELFVGGGQSPMVRPYPQMFLFLSSAVTERRRLLDNVCQIKLQKLRESPRLPKSLLVVPRVFFERQQFNTGYSRLACDLLEDAIQIAQQSYERGLSFFNEIINHRPPEEGKRLSIPLQLNASPDVNLRRLCFSLQRHPSASVLDDANPCSPQDLVLPHQEEQQQQQEQQQPQELQQEQQQAGQASAYTTQPQHADGEEVQHEVPSTSEDTSQAQLKNGNEVLEETSFIEGAQEPIARPGPAETNRLVVDYEKLEFYFGVIAVTAEIQTALPPLMTQLSVDWLDTRLREDPRTYDAIVQATEKNREFCERLKTNDFQKELKKQKAKSAMDYAVKCTASSTEKGWKKMNCAKYTSLFQCNFFENTAKILDNRIDIPHALGWLARQEPCVGQHCKDWRKQHPFAVLASNHQMYEHFGLYSPWLRALLVLNEWFGLLDMQTKGGAVKDSIFGLNGFRANYLLQGRHQKKSILKKILSVFKKKEQLTAAHVRFLKSQLSADAWEALQSSFRPVVHPSVFHHLNQYASFYSEASGAVRDPGGLAGELDKLIEKWTYNGMPKKAQDKLKRGLQAQTRDMLGFDLTAAPPEMNSLNSSLKETLFRSMNKLLEQQDIREQQWLACQRPSHTWPFLQLLQDSWHLLKQAGDNLLLVGIVTTPQETSLKTKKSFLNRVKDKISRAIDKLFRMSPYQAQHATYAAVVPDYAKVALLLKELSNIYHNNPAVFPSADVFLRAAESLFDTLQTQFYSPQAVPPAVPVTALVSQVDPLYATLESGERAQEFRRSTFSIFFAHLWRLALNVAAEGWARPDAAAAKEKEYSKTSWQRSLYDPLQVNSFRMVLAGGDLGRALLDNLLPPKQKKMLKSLRYGTGVMFTYHSHYAGQLYRYLGYPAFGNFLSAQAPFFGQMINQWRRKRQSDRAAEIMGWLGLALFFAGSVVAVANQLNALAEVRLDGVSGGAAGSGGGGVAGVGNQSGLAGSTGCGPLGICLDAPVQEGSGISAQDPLNPPPFSASPVLTAVAIVSKAVIMASFASLLGPALSLYVIVRSHFKFLERLEMAVSNLWKWMIYKIRHSSFGRWYKKIKEGRKNEREAKRLEKLMKGEQKGPRRSKKRGKGSSRRSIRDDADQCELETDSAFDLQSLSEQFSDIADDSELSSQGGSKRRKKGSRKSGEDNSSKARTLTTKNRKVSIKRMFSSRGSKSAKTPSS